MPKLKRDLFVVRKKTEIIFNTIIYFHVSPNKKIENLNKQSFCNVFMNMFNLQVA